MRKGIGTTLGMIFFIGILFSTIVPLQLYLKENDMLLTRIEREMETADEYRELEELSLVAYPTNLTSDKIMVRIRNRGAIPTVVKRLWINEASELLEESLYPGEQVVLGPFSIVLEVIMTYGVKVSTERGRIFTSDAGNLAFIAGTWYTPSLGINVQIANDKGKYYISVSNSTWSSFYQTQGQDEGDLIVFFDVKTNGDYLVICRKNSISGPNLPGTPMVVEVMWPGGSPVVYVYTSGLEL